MEREKLYPSPEEEAQILIDIHGLNNAYEKVLNFLKEYPSYIKTLDLSEELTYEYWEKISKILSNKIGIIKVGSIGTLTWGDGTISKVEIVDIHYGSYNKDYWLKYLEEETHRPLIHPDYNKNKNYIKSEILLPELIFKKSFKLEQLDE